MTHGGVGDSHPKPRLRRKLEHPTDEVSYDVGMTHIDFVAVGCLVGVGSVEIFAESGFDTKSVLGHLLNEGGREGGFIIDVG